MQPMPSEILFIQWLHRVITNNVPRSALNSLGFRLCFLMIMCPTLGWWLVGPCYIPLLPVRKARSHMEKLGDSQGSGTADDPTPGQQLPPVSFSMPKCRFLKAVRDEFGEQVGQQKCLNE